MSDNIFSRLFFVPLTYSAHVQATSPTFPVLLVDDNPTIIDILSRAASSNFREAIKVILADDYHAGPNE